MMLMVGTVLAYLFGSSQLPELAEVCLDYYVTYGPKLAAAGGWGFAQVGAPAIFVCSCRNDSAVGLSRFVHRFDTSDRGCYSSLAAHYRLRRHA